MHTLTTTAQRHGLSNDYRLVQLPQLAVEAYCKPCHWHKALLCACQTLLQNLSPRWLHLIGLQGSGANHALLLRLDTPLLPDPSSHFDSLPSFSAKRAPLSGDSKHSSSPHSISSWAASAPSMVNRPVRLGSQKGGLCSSNGWGCVVISQLFAGLVVRQVLRGQALAVQALPRQHALCGGRPANAQGTPSGPGSLSA